MVGQKQDLFRRPANPFGNPVVGGTFALGTGDGQIEPAADQRRQLATTGVSEPILLIADGTR